MWRGRRVERKFFFTSAIPPFPPSAFFGNIFIIYNTDIHTYRHPTTTPHTQNDDGIKTHKQQQQQQQQNSLLWQKYLFFVLLLPLENVMLLVEVLLSVCVRRHGFYVQNESEREALFSEFHPHAMCWGENKNLWMRWKHHPIFCVYGTFRKIFFPIPTLFFSSSRCFLFLYGFHIFVCRMQTLKRWSEK